MLHRTYTFILAAAAVLLVSSAQAAQPIKIGIVGPMAFVQGDDMWLAAQMARDEINQAGGVKVGNVARPIELVKVDSNEIQSVPDATNAMERAITRDKVDLLIGGFRTEAVLAMQDVAMDYKKIFLGVGAAHDKLGQRVEEDYDRYKYWFRAGPTKSSDLGKTLFAILADVANQVRTQLNAPEPKVAILAEKAQWTDSIVKASQAVLPKMKMQVVGVWQPSPIASDVTAELSAIRRANADIIFTALSGPVGVVVGRQAGELQIPAVQFGLNVEAERDGYWRATAGKANYYVSILETYGEDVAVTPKTIAFVNEFRKRYDKRPTGTAQAYDAVYLAKEAIEKTGDLNPDKLVATLEKTDFVGPSSHLVFDKRHDETFGPGLATGVGVQWQNGKKVAFWPNNWQGLTYAGVKPFEIPPTMVAQKKNGGATGAAGAAGGASNSDTGGQK